MEWGDVNNWVMYGGSFLGTQKQLPEKNMEKVAAAFANYNFHGLLLVGGFEVIFSFLRTFQSWSVLMQFSGEEVHR